MEYTLLDSRLIVHPSYDEIYSYIFERVIPATPEIISEAELFGHWDLVDVYRLGMWPDEAAREVVRTDLEHFEFYANNTGIADFGDFFGHHDTMPFIWENVNNHFMATMDFDNRSFEFRMYNSQVIIFGFTRNELLMFQKANDITQTDNNVIDNSATVGTGQLEGNYYIHVAEWTIDRLFYFSGNRFVMYAPYAAIIEIWDSHNYVHIPHARDFFNSVAHFEGTFTIDENNRIIQLHYNLESIQQGMHGLLTHPFILAAIERYPYEFGWAELTVEQIYESSRQFVGELINRLTYEDGFDVLYMVMNGGRVNYSEPITRGGLTQTDNNVIGDGATVSTGQLEGNYYIHADYWTWSNGRIFSFSGNRFVLHIPYALVIEAWDQYEYYVTRVPYTTDFFNSVTYFEGTFTIDEYNRIIHLHYNLESIRQGIYNVLAHPFILAHTQRFWPEYVTFFEQLDEVVDGRVGLWYNEILFFSLAYEDGFDVLFIIRGDRVDYSEPITRGGR